jgi:hypothetical protein
MEIAPPPCNDASAATTALQNTLAGRPPGLARVLVNLAGYSDPGVPPAAMRMMDGVVLVVIARRTLRAAVLKMEAQVPDAARLGAILIG